MSSTRAETVVILGAGINGCALARELLLNCISVWLVDTADIASGATSGSSRLVHGGLRYLEYGEFDLVKESLGERTKLLRLAPQFVRPLKLWIPAGSRFGGAIGAPGRFMGWNWWPTPQPKHGRGVWLICAGLQMYDVYARDPTIPKHEVMPSTAEAAPLVDRQHYPWVCSYYDGQVAFPERLVLSMLADAESIARQQGLDFRVLNYHQARLEGKTVTVSPLEKSATSEAMSIEPAAIVNATGAWVDLTLAQLNIPSQRLMGGTKGTHFFSFNPRLREALRGDGIYAEADDGRPMFILPLADAVLVGTTDVPSEGSPRDAVATPSELDYLLNAVNTVFPQVKLTESDINFHYCAVRPLPYVDAKTPAAITRRHAIVPHEGSAVPLWSLVGGKLTTMRSLAEQTVETLWPQLGRGERKNSESRPFPGSEDYPADAAAQDARVNALAAKYSLPPSAIANAWRVHGTRLETVLQHGTDRGLLAGADLPAAVAHWAIDREWARTLADLSERRLMLLYHERLTRETLLRLAEMLSAAGHISADAIEATVAAEVERLHARYGKHVVL